ncbi:unnamed protein product [Lasius platythorax]|uniref:DUF35 domain-containing protein n=1 Tax=Lasius platythorax TaxID=488582 RepID=A0AAV2N024_9HYME
MDLRNLFVSCRECDEMFHWREHSHLCRACRRAPVVGRELSADLFWRACSAIFRSNAPYSLWVRLDVFSGVREVYEVVPVPRDLAWRIPFQSVQRALEGRQPFPFYGEVPEALHIRVESVRFGERASPPASPSSSPISPPSRAPIPRPGLRHG